jgi:hypothetical protein
MKTTTQAAWRVTVDAASDRAARVLLERVVHALGGQATAVSVEPHHDGGYVLRFKTSVTSSSWPEVVTGLLEAGQRFGRFWLLHGTIAEEVDAYSTETSIAGVKQVHLHCSRRGATGGL